MVIPNASTHLNFALLVMLLLLFTIRLLSYQELAIFIISGLVGGLLPDIDHEKATMSKIIPFYLLHRIFRRWTSIFKHGGITHTVLINSIFYIGYWCSMEVVLLGLGIGYSSHIYIDHVDGNKLNMLWYPFHKRRRGRK